MSELVTEKMYKIEQVAVMVDVSYKTIQNWYDFKRAYPEHQISKMLPEFIQYGCRQTRYWTPEAVEQLKFVKANIPRGQTGLMAAITQKYVKNKNKHTKNM